ncbi:MAG: hypothetical protein K0S38_133 [Candidatus Paceibacter sp.]|nr:hypothetical protein [Candidatus Paceibacter sp.]
MGSQSYLWLRSRKWIDPIGRFFEALAGSVLRAKSANAGYEDLAIRRIGLGFEVKSTDNNHHLRVRWKQFMQHVEELSGGFPNPYDHLVYCLFGYRNLQSRATARKSKRGVRRSLIGRCKTELEVFTTLAQKVDFMYIFHEDALVAIREQHGTKRGVMPCEPDSDALELRRKILHMFKPDNATEVLEAYGLSRTRWSVRELSMRINLEFLPIEPHLAFMYRIRHPIELRVVEVLPRSVSAKLESVVKPRASGLTQRHLRLRCTYGNVPVIAA